jgi:valyl-tRNA synthetase
MMELSSRYNPADTEDKWYKYWLEKDYFSSTPDSREAYTIVIPPPNVTGVLHMGHMLNNTIQDVLIRKARQEGKNACWVPGTDHASIATEAKVVRMLREKGIKKSDLSREEFLQHAWDWKNEYGGIILKQLQKLGASCDWNRTAFTMDESRSAAVIKVFVDLYHKEKLYRKKRMVNWDPEAKTVLSNEEVIYQVEDSQLFYIKYYVENSEEYLLVATTRPETIPGDTAVAVHPEDPRYSHLKGKKLVVPGIGRVVPVIFDDYVDIEFGTGALKVTPAHDVNDFEIGERHQLDIIDVFNEDGTMSIEAGIYPGLDRFEVRKKFAKDLENAGLLEKKENYKNNVGRSERTNCVVEPRLSLQWYVDMTSLAKPALEAVSNDDVRFFPPNQKNVYKHWMENLKDWCISRQLWWGHRIPAWYLGEDVFVAESVEKALALAQSKTGNPQLSIDDLKQDEDVLDTWFSSWLWPISVFDGFDPEKSQLDYYYPTNVLVTGWDIIFLWVARMIMAGFEWKNTRPFHDVYFTGMVRDKQRRKMSKQLGNSPDALQLIEQYGADGVRFGMLSCSPAGGDLLFDEKLCEQGRNFNNKIWNAFRLIQSFQSDANLPMSEKEKEALEWINHQFQKTVNQVHQSFEEYRLSEALIHIYSYVWNDFCSWYLEIIKPGPNEPVSYQLIQLTGDVFKNICSLLHPFMPFITEELYSHIKTKEENDCIYSTFPATMDYDKDLVGDFEQLKDIVTQLRDLRNRCNISPKQSLTLFAISNTHTKKLAENPARIEIIKKLTNLDDVSVVTEESRDAQSFISRTEKFFIEVQLEIDAKEKISELTEELNRQKAFVSGVEAKLGNERFVNGAPQAIVDREIKKLADGNARILLLQEEIKRFESL